MVNRVFDKKLFTEMREKYKDVIEDKSFPSLSLKQENLFLNGILALKDQLQEGTVTGDVQKYDPTLLKVMRRSIPQTIGPEIFGTQVMTGPTGLLFAMRAVYQNTTSTPIKRSNSVILVLADGSGFTEGSDISSSGTGIGTVVYVEDNKVLVKITSGTFTAAESVDDASTYSSPVTTITTTYENEASYRIIFKDYAKFSSVATAELAGITQRELGFVIEKTNVTADSFKLKAKYTDELIQDVRSQQGIDAEATLIEMLGNEVAIEQNRRFIDFLITRALAGGHTTFDYNSTLYGGDADGRWSLEKSYSLYQYVNKIANQIAKTTLRGRGNFLVCSLDIASIFEASKFWSPASANGGLYSGISDVNLGNSAFVGVLGGKYKVYVDLYADTNYIAIGYKGTNDWDAGIYYCPYVPVYTKKLADPETGQPVVFFHTRYGMGENPFGSELYYRLITVENV